MLSQLIDALSQDRDLNLRRTSILGIDLKITDNRLFSFFGQRHANKPFNCTIIPVDSLLLCHSEPVNQLINLGYGQTFWKPVELGARHGSLSHSNAFAFTIGYSNDF